MNMKNIFLTIMLLSAFANLQVKAQEAVTNKNGKEITVNTPASTSSQGQVKLAGDLAGTADAPTVPALSNKVEGSGTLNYIPKFTAGKILGNSQLFDNGTRVGIGTTSPGNTLEINQGTAGNSGLRFSNLTSSSTASTSSSKVLGLNSSGDVILTNVPGTQNIVAFSTATPTTSGVVFTPDTPADQSVVYQSSVDNSMWTYNGTSYVTYTAPASTAWYTSGTTNDAGNSKTSNIYRAGSVGIGISPAVPLDVQATGAASYLGIAKFLAPSNTSAGNASQLFFGTSSSVGNSAEWRYVYQSSGASTNRVDFGMNGYSNPMMSYLNNGNVGIGLTNPQVKLQIQGISAAQGANANAQLLRLSRPSVSGTKWDNIAQFNLGTYYDDSPTANNVDAKSRLDVALTNGANNSTLSTVMTWLANGFVGINNTAPSAPLVVQGTVGTGSLKLIAPVVNSSGDNWWMGFGHGTTSTDANDRARIGVDILTGGSGRLFFTTGAPGSQNRAMFIDESQKVGIGTSTPLNKLVVKGLNNAVSALGTDQTNATFRIDGDTNHSLDMGTFTTSPWGSYIQSHNKASTSSLPLSINPVGGSVGIGTVNPLVKLHIKGDLVTSNTANADESLIRMSRPISQGTKYPNQAQFNLGSYNDGVTGNAINAKSRLDLALTNVADETTFNNVMTWLGNGNVGIGSTAPISKLEVNGSATNTTAYNSGSATAILFNNSNLAYTSASPGSFSLQGMKDGGTYTLAVQGTTAGTSSFLGLNPAGTSFSFKSINNGLTIAGTHTLYTFIVMGTTVYYHMAAGF